jgi:hypothetical protein
MGLFAAHQVDQPCYGPVGFSATGLPFQLEHPGQVHIGHPLPEVIVWRTTWRRILPDEL